ncbi:MULTISPECIES: LamG domain-containing protein [unclassified Agarivorans]|uniref:LamG domain-containing protein n=1 Tax=unclassified Agarivorans TaxID=2636026 RepID=UPI0026E32AC1|nr:MULTISPECIES: LamG domain-containing protein [unclassified Agarivorans]MDO6684895.1 LamG domain-containing protein [Agarivorans sp. 3_MG-2023]MDO6714944.1 LamG domain-containing protein [Agarivorans sp. 2_MG-2023]MDO6764136.1 LamG domain-containing protein [Agarivorans sp. 1_MG-2023]
MKKIISNFCWLLTLLIFTLSVESAEIARYKLDGSPADSGPNVMNGRLYGNVNPTTDRHGNTNSAMRFNGGLIQVDLFRNHDFGNQLTISFWMRRTSSSNYMGIINNGHSAKSFDIRMGRENGGTFLFANSQWGSGNLGVSSRNFINIGSWHHVAIVFNDGLARLYIDGQKLHENFIPPSSLSVFNTPLTIGSNGNGLGHEPFKGSLDDIWMFDEALSDTDIFALAQGTYQPTMQVKLELVSNQTDIPPSGGSITYNAEITNNIDNDTTDFIKWAVLTLPNGQDYPILSPEAINIAINDTTHYQNQTGNIPSWFPPGQYTYRFYVADPAKPNGNILNSYVTFKKL